MKPVAMNASSVHIGDELLVADGEIRRWETVQEVDIDNLGGTDVYILTENRNIFLRHNDLVTLRRAW